MQNTVFFSWQSDLPNNKNRNFIESCLSNSVKNLKKDIEYRLEINIDRDTKSKLGTPDITESIFDKINKCDFFIADISIINSKSRKYRKTPNPNVLVELGYAAKKLGWNKIICVFNTEFGKISDLPFDLRNRRILPYEFNSENKLSAKRNVEKIFYSALMENYKTTAFSYELLDYYNSDIYFVLLKLIMNFYMMVFGYNNDSSLDTTQKVVSLTESNIENVVSFDKSNISKVLSLTELDIEKALNESTFLGFQLFKYCGGYLETLSTQLEKIVPLRNFDDDYYVPLVKLIVTLRTYDKVLRSDNMPVLNCLNQANNNFEIRKHYLEQRYPNRRILLKVTNENEGIITDFGDFRRDYITNLTQEFTLTSESLRFYKGFIVQALKEINAWIDNNHGEFFVDDSKLEF